MLLLGAVLAPATLPLLPPDRTSRYVAALGIVPRIERSDGSDLPLWLAGRYGWEDYVNAVAEAAARLDAEEHSRAIILAPEYARAASIEFLGRDRDLPPVYSGHNTYFLWGPPRESIDVVIVAGFSVPGPSGPLLDPGLAAFFQEVTLFRVHDCEWCPAWLDRTAIWIARGPRRSIAESWGELRRFR